MLQPYICLIKCSVMESINEYIKVGEDVLNHLGEVLLAVYGEAFVLVDSNTRKHCLPILLKHMPAIH